MVAISKRIQLLPHQVEVFRSPARQKLLLSGIGGGKTRCGSDWTVEKALTYPSPVLATANTNKQLNRVTVPALKEALARWGIQYHYEETKQRFSWWANGYERNVLLSSVEKYDYIRGIEFGHAWCDEGRDYKKDALDVIIGRLRHPGTPGGLHQLLVTSTPNGYDHLQTRFAARQVPGRQIIKALTFDNPYLPDEYILEQLLSLDPRKARQELWADFINLTSGQQYVEFDRRESVRDDLCVWDPKQAIVVTHDYNVDPMTAVALHVDTDLAGRKTFRVFREWKTRVGGIRGIVDKITKDLEGQQAAVFVNGDPAAKARKFDDGETNWDVLKACYRESPIGHLVSFRSLRQAPQVVSRVNSVNAALYSAAGRRSLFIHSDCKELWLDFEQNVWGKDGRSTDKSDRDRTHLVEALGYEIADHRPVNAEKPRLELEEALY